VLLFAPVAGTEEKPVGSVAEEVRALIREQGFTEMEALKRVARGRGIGKSEAYREMQRERGR
jgi:16S rRNA (cytidine1402-2'-O)-methyltransferase